MRIEFKTPTGKPESTWDLNPKQERFMRSQTKNLCYWGGRGCGKSAALVLKIIHLMLNYRNNYGLLGRYNYSDLRDTTVKDFLDICPKIYIKQYYKQERRILFINGSQLIFRGLKDVSKKQIRSLNLGFCALEQAEEIEEGLVNELEACLRKDVKDDDGKKGIQQMLILCNPGINWIYKRYIQEIKNISPIDWQILGKNTRGAEYELIKGSMFDNAQNLGDAFLQRMMAMPESWKTAFVYGEIDKTLLSERKVFPIEYTENQVQYLRQVLFKLDDIEFYERRKEHLYQIGVDPSEGVEDSSVVKGIDVLTGREVASWVGKIPPDLLAHKIVKMADYLRKPRVVLEINGIGMATLTKLKELNYGNIFIREEYDRHAKIYTKKLGWRTTHSSKPLLTGHFTELLAYTDLEGNKKSPFVKLSDRLTLEEMRTFLYSDKAYSKGMGAELGFHDDRVMATMLAYWDVQANKDYNEELIVRPKENKIEKWPSIHLQEILKGFKTKKWLEI